MKKKIISLMMAAVLPVMMMAGCGSADNTQSGSSVAADTTAAQESVAGTAEAANTEKTGDPYKIGVVMYQWTDAQGTNIQNFCKYLQENMNVEFEYESTFYDDDAQVSCVENLISSGCQAIISGYDTNIVAAMSTCADAGVYYVVALDHITEDDFAGTDPGQYFLGGTKQFGGDLAALGKEYADAVADSGITNVGGISFPAWAFSDAPEIYASFQSELQSKNIAVQDLTFTSGMTSDDVQQNTKDLINQNSDMDAVFGMASGLDYVYPALQGSNVKLIAMGYDTSVESLMNSGALLAAGNNNHTQAIASCVARIINALEGNSYPDSADGQYNEGSIVNGVAGYPVIGTTEDLQNYQNYVVPENGADGCVTAEELENCIISYNADATLADLNTLTNRSLSDIVAARQ